MAAYSQPGVYSQPMTYGAPPMIVRPVPNKMAVWAMWMGIVGIGGGFVCGLLSMMPIIGVVFSVVAMFLWVAPVLAVIFGHIGLEPDQTHRRRRPRTGDRRPDHRLRDHCPGPDHGDRHDRHPGHRLPGHDEQLLSCFA
jgi:hypothetical protein